MSARKVARPVSLSRRERQIMDVLYRTERATAAEVREGLVPPPSYSTVRAQLRVLEEKGHVRHEDDGLRYVYVPVVSRKSARDGVVRLGAFHLRIPAKKTAAIAGRRFFVTIMRTITPKSRPPRRPGPSRAAG